MKITMHKIIPIALLLLAGCGGSSGGGNAGGGTAGGGGGIAGGGGSSGGGGGGGGGGTAASGDMVVLLSNGCAALTSPVASPGDDIGGDTWATYAQGFFASYCTRCHSSTLTGNARNGAPDGYNWDQQASVKTHGAMIRMEVGANDEMPVSMPFPSCEERLRISKWLDAGQP